MSGDRVIFVGNPNVGKSLLFGVLTGRYVTVSNYPGTTVELTRGSVSAGGRLLEAVDTPGTNTLIPQSEDERVTRDVLLSEPGAVLQVGDARNLPRALALTVELAEAGVPLALCLNMWDEARESGLSIDAEALSREIGVDVAMTVATERQGTGRLPGLIARARPSELRVDYPAPIEAQIARISPLLPPAPVSRRALAAAVLAGDPALASWLERRLEPGAAEVLEDARRAAERGMRRPLAPVFQEARWSLASRLAEQVTRQAARPRVFPRAALGRLGMHPLWGAPAAVAVLWLVYQFVGVFGAGTLVDLLEDDLFGTRRGSLQVSLDAEGRIEPAGGVRDDGAARVVGVEDGAVGTVRVRLRAGREAGADSGAEAAVPSTGGSAAPGAVRGPAGAAAIRDGEGPRVALVAATDPPSALVSAAAPGGGGTWIVEVQRGRPVRLTVEEWTGQINPRVRQGLQLVSPWPIASDLVAGPYGLVTMGLTYAIAIVLPIVATFFLAFSVLEDSGYLPRLAVMANRVFRIMGLNGRAVMPMVLGLGCDTMATMTTRILGTRRERLIVILLLALGVPCSAQLGVVLGMLAALSWKATLLWVAVLLGVILVVGHLASRVLPGSRADFIMEIPPLRIPKVGNLVRKTLARVEWYLKEAVPLFLLGTLLLFAADRLGVLKQVERLAEPVVTGLLGLPAQAAEAFVIGFLRRDFGAAGLYRLAEEGRLDPIQVVVSLVTMTLFIPCIASFFMIVKEQGARIALAVALFVFPFALGVGALLNLALRHSGVDLS